MLSKEEALEVESYERERERRARLAQEPKRDIRERCLEGPLTGDLQRDTSKPSNPKDILGSDKIPFHLFPQTAAALGSLAMLEGLLKYGRGNYRAIGVRSSIYYDALLRHMTAWFEGEDIDPDSGLPHLGKALACIAILIDAQAAGQLNDDRQFPGGYHQLMKDITPHVKRLKTRHQQESPKHYTIEDVREGD